MFVGKEHINEKKASRGEESKRENVDAYKSVSFCSFVCFGFVLVRKILFWASFLKLEIEPVA